MLLDIGYIVGIYGVVRYLQIMSKTGPDADHNGVKALAAFALILTAVFMFDLYVQASNVTNQIRQP